jgi:hypothetical protein
VNNVIKGLIVDTMNLSPGWFAFFALILTYVAFVSGQTIADRRRHCRADHCFFRLSLQVRDRKFKAGGCYSSRQTEYRGPLHRFK